MLQNIALHYRRATLLAAAGIMALSAALPILVVQHAGAAPSLQQRKLETTSAVPADTGVTLNWTFDTPADVANIKTIEIEFCDTPLTPCIGMDGDDNGNSDNIPLVPGSPSATLSGFTSNAVASTTRDAAGRGTSADNQITIVKTNADAGASLTGASIEIGGFTNDDEVNATYFTRMRMYSDDPASTLVYEGVFAQSTSQTLTVNARVQERLDFCVGATTANDATTNVGDCNSIGGTSVDIGNVENNNVNVSPVDAVNGGSDTNGLAFIRTNAVNGASIAYRSLTDNNSGTLKVPGAVCDDSNGGTVGPDILSVATVDQCFNTSGTQGVFSAGTERFGMTVAGVNCQVTNAYLCDYAGDVYNLRLAAEYDGVGDGSFVADENQIAGTAAGYAWEADPSVTTTLASSASALPPTGFRVIDNEALILKFAATAAVTTPTGSYSVQTDFIATTTF